jgi:hypothetical protein
MKEPIKTAKAKEAKEGAQRTRVRKPEKIARIGCAKPGKPNDVSWHLAFLESLRNSPNVSAAAAAASVSTKTAYEHRKKFLEFAKNWQAALEEGTDNLIGAAYERAQKGVLKPVYQQGKLVGHVREYSDTLTIFLLKNHRPSVYGDKSSLQHSGSIITQTPEETVANAKRLEACLISTMKAAAGLGRKQTA